MSHTNYHQKLQDIDQEIMRLEEKITIGSYSRSFTWRDTQTIKRAIRSLLRDKKRLLDEWRRVVQYELLFEDDHFRK